LGFLCGFAPLREGPLTLKGHFYSKIILNSYHLDYLSAASKMTGRGIGGALYERLRGDAFARGSRGLFFECLPDDPALCPDAKQRAQNRARLKFYEQ